MLVNALARDIVPFRLPIFKEWAETFYLLRKLSETGFEESLDFRLRSAQHRAALLAFQRAGVVKRDHHRVIHDHDIQRIQRANHFSVAEGAAGLGLEGNDLHVRCLSERVGLLLRELYAFCFCVASPALFFFPGLRLPDQPLY